MHGLETIKQMNRDAVTFGEWYVLRKNDKVVEIHKKKTSEFSSPLCKDCSTRIDGTNFAGMNRDGKHICRACLERNYL